MPNCVGLDLTQTSNRLKAMEVPILAMSVWTDMHTKALAERFGSAALLDEMRLGDDLIPTFKTIAQKFRSVGHDQDIRGNPRLFYHLP